MSNQTNISAPRPEVIRVHDARVALDRAQRTPGAQTTNLAGSLWLAQQAERNAKAGVSHG